MDSNQQKSITIDDLAVIVAKGFDDVTTSMATKRDVAELKQEISEVKHEVWAVKSKLNNYLELSKNVTWN